MTSQHPPFLDLTFHPELRAKVLSADAALVFSSNLSRVLWSNASGAAMFGGSGIADLMDARLSDHHPLVKQLRQAARQMDGEETVVRRFKIPRGLKTETVESELSSIDLPGGGSAILLVGKDGGKAGKRREYDLAQDAIQALAGFADAAAIVDEFGLSIATSDAFEDADIDPDLLEDLVREAAGREEPLLKKPLDEAADGSLVAGIARLKDRPGRYLIVLAEEEAAAEDQGTEDKSKAEPSDGAVSGTAAGMAAATVAGAAALASSQEEQAEPEEAKLTGSEDRLETAFADDDTETSQELEETPVNGEMAPGSNSTSAETVDATDNDAEADEGRAKRHVPPAGELDDEGSEAGVDQWYFEDDGDLGEPDDHADDLPEDIAAASDDGAESDEEEAEHEPAEDIQRSGMPEFGKIGDEIAVLGSDPDSETDAEAKTEDEDGITGLGDDRDMSSTEDLEQGEESSRSPEALSDDEESAAEAEQDAFSFSDEADLEEAGQPEVSLDHEDEASVPTSEDDIREFDIPSEVDDTLDQDETESVEFADEEAVASETQASDGAVEESETTAESVSDEDEPETDAENDGGKEKTGGFKSAGAAASAIAAAAGGFLLRRGKKASEPPKADDIAEREPERGAETVRFAFTTDEDQVIQSVSGELASVVGEHSGDIAGQRWEAIAKARNFDEDGTILSLLRKADTWSGKTVLWPVDGTDMCVPVDLAALPVFGRDRAFEGFRGFGMIRTADMMVDSNATGAAFAAGAGPEPDSAEENPSEPDEDTTGLPPVDASTEQAHPANEDEIEGSNLDDYAERLGGPLFGPDDDIEAEEQEAGDETSLDAAETELGDEAEDDGEADEEAPLPAGESTDDRANVFHLPQRGGSEDRKAVESTQNTASNHSGPSSAFGRRSGLSSREHDAFNEIRRSLTGNDAPAPPEKQDRFPEDPGAHAGHSLSTRQPSGAAASAENTKGPAGKKNGLLASLPVPLLIYRTGETLFANAELIQKSGYESLEELSEAGGVDALFGISDEALGDAGQSITLRRKDGTGIPVRSRLSKVDWEGEKALCLTFEERLEQRPALDMIRVSELENILETAADGVLVLDPQGRIESINSSGEGLFNRQFEELQGSPFKVLFATESQPVIEQYFSNLETTGIPGIMNQGQEVLGHEAGGGFIPLFLTLGKVGETDRVCAVLRDLSSWKKAEEELVKARRSAETASEQKSLFLSRMSHEIREPLNAIIGFSDVMVEERFGPIDNERYKGYLRDINRSGIHVLDLVNDLLDISKIEAGKLELSYEAVDLNKLASETVALLQPQANEKRIIIRTSLSRAVPKVVADARSIRQIILNLVSNAINHSPRNSQVIVSTTFEENGEVGLRIRDTGRGMTETELKRALEPFAQVGEDRMQRGGGTGLGLPLTKALVEANRAYFDLESAPGEGTIAHIQFPSQRVLAD